MSGYMYQSEDGGQMYESEQPRMAFRAEYSHYGLEHSNQSADDTDILTSLGAIMPARGAIPAKIETVPGVAKAHALLGTGTHSQVWSCSMEGETGEVAVKLMLATTSGMANSSEAMLMQKMQHPNLVKLLGVVDGPPSALILELCLGGTVTQFLYDTPDRASGTFAMESRLKPALEVADALSYLHSVDVMHRDIKASNVLFTASPWAHVGGWLPAVKLGDLGLSRLVGHTEHMTQCVGTLCYMAPENITSCEYGFPADVFGVAIFTNELVMGERPFGGEDVNTAMIPLRIAKGLRPRICEDAVTQEIVSVGWSQDPQARWSAQEMARRLHERIQGWDGRAA